MAESRITTLHAILRPKIVRWGAASLFGLGAYDAASSQFGFPKLGKVLGMSGMLLPWWGWLLILQAVFVYGLFDYVRRIPQDRGSTTTAAFDDTAIRGQIEALRQEFGEHQAHISKVLSDFDRARLEGLEAITRTAAIQAAETVGIKQQTEAQFTSLDYAISAIGHREILLRKAGILETLGEELVIRDGVSLSDPKAWQSWQHTLSKWEVAKQHWITHALPYRPDVASLVDTVPEAWYEQEWSIGLSEFPTIAALRKYQTWEGQRKNWEYARTTVDPLVFGVAFYGKRPIGAA